MKRTNFRTVSVLAVAALAGGPLLPVDSPACCAISAGRSQVVNADQTVIILWDSTSRTQRFIRQASFKSDADDVGFIVPSPSRPQLEESGDKAFETLRDITKPVSRGGGAVFPIGCAADAPRACLLYTSDAADE